MVPYGVAVDEFETCKCKYFINGIHKLCGNCNHANIWHSLSKPPTDEFLAFISPRKIARKPIYISYNKLTIFKPVSPVIEQKVPPNYCDDVDNLPA